MRKLIICLMSLMFAFTLFGNSQQETTVKNGKQKIRWVRAGNEQNPETDRILLELQDRLGIELEIISIPWDQFPNKLNIMMASGEQIDLINCDPGVTLNNWVNEGLVLAYDDFIGSGKYPYIESVVNSDLYAGLKINGKSYYKPLPLAPMQWGNIIRKDWLDNVELDMPTTLDELYEVIKAFKYDDPDGNGIDDTYGWYANTGGDNLAVNFTMMINAFSINSSYWIEKEDGTLTRFEVSENSKEAARFIRKLDQEGLINKDWMSVKWDPSQGTRVNAFATGKVGIMTTSIPDTFESKTLEMNPNAEVVFLPPVSGPDGQVANVGHTGGFWWGNVIPASCSNPEKVLELLEYAMTKEGRELTHYGIKDTHFTDVTEEDGKIIYTINKAECDKDWDTAKNGYLYPLTWGGFNWFEYAYIPIKEYGFDFDKAYLNIQAMLPEEMASGHFADWTARNAQYAFAGPLMNNFDDKLLGDQSKLNSIYMEGWFKSILTPDDFDEEWNKMESRYLSAGGQEIIDYANQIYKK